ncbi:MAG TPA: SDR family NAD(P)-dependent oxidoreductase [Acidimicrobiales bacterium]|nr:SDR family NAD(P)-dependent oxidoreductase [Acidimicrobiales bacterium]
MNDAFGLPQTLVVLGGTSEIAEAIVGSLVAERCRTVVLAGRDAASLAGAADRARAAGAEVVETVIFDATDVEHAEGTVERCFAAAGGSVDMVLVAVGLLGDQERDEADAGRIARMVTVDFTWPAAAVGAAAGRLRSQGQGRIVVLSSVAGVRVRRANFLYGASKAGLDAFTRGLAEATRGSGVRVQVVRPGFVRTKMTVGLRPAPFAASPEDVAQAVRRGCGTNRPVIWVPPMLRWAFLALGHLPQSLWRRLPG